MVNVVQCSCVCVWVFPGSGSGSATFRRLKTRAVICVFWVCMRAGEVVWGLKGRSDAFLPLHGFQRIEGLAQAFNFRLILLHF